MAMSIFSRSLLAAALLATTVFADLKTYNFTAGWVTRNPDGAFSRRVMGINGQWPIPTIFANVGDRVVVNFKNDLGDRSCSLHFHGLFQNGTTHMDGASQSTQCPIPVNSTFTYRFNVSQPGTYWYHSHVDGQYPDGLRGPLIVHDPENPYKNLYDEELVITLSDWYHDEMPGLIKQFMSYRNPTGAEPIPKSALMNDTQNMTISVQPGKTYFIRLINMAAFAAQYFWIEGHSFRIIELDGIYHEPKEASQLYLTAAQRYGILLTTKNSTSTNFAIHGSMDTDLFDKIPARLDANVTSYLVYNKTAPLPKPTRVDEFDPIDDTLLVPTDKEAIFENPSQSLVLNMSMGNLGDGANYAFFNDITFVRPKVPSLYTALTSGNQSTNPAIYGVNTHPIVLAHNEVVEIALNNMDPGKHPFHLHGHAFQVLARSDKGAGLWSSDWLKNGSITFPTTPMRRDTLLVRPHGFFVIRFRSDNPGIWLFHCHIEWHVDSGLILTFVEAPRELQTQLTNQIPQDHFDACKAQGMPIEGNAAGNTKNLLDLSGANVSPAPLPAGFTNQGIVAFVFSCLAGILGVGVIIWYGLGELGIKEQQQQQQQYRASQGGNAAAKTGLEGPGGDIIAAAPAATAATLR